MKHLIMIGAGGFGRECYWHALDSIGYGEEFDLKGYLDDTPKGVLREDLLSMPRIGTIDGYEIQNDDVFICTIADPHAKEKIINKILDRGGKFINLIHKTAIIHGTVKIGIGNVIIPSVMIHDHATVGNFVTFNGMNMGHDSEVGDFTSGMGGSGPAGFGKVGKRVYLATNAIVCPHAVVEDDAYVGVGSVVFKRVKKGKKVFGNPAVELPDGF